MGFKDGGKPHYLGDRGRLRRRFREADAEAISDYELFELILFRAAQRRDTKPLAKALLARFGSFAEVLNAWRFWPKCRVSARRPLPSSSSCALRPLG